MNPIDTTHSADTGSANADHPETLWIGDPLIDSEHRALLRALGEITIASDTPEGRRDFFDVLSQFGGALSSHFEHEEALMRSIAMPDAAYAAHVQAHETIVEQYAVLNIDLMQGRQAPRNSVRQLVRQWILDHIIHHDLAIRDYLALAHP